MPDFSFELDAVGRGMSSVCGVDEAGRGPLAGPVVAAAVVLDPEAIPQGLNDSKKLTEDRREALFAQIVATSQVGFCAAPVELRRPFSNWRRTLLTVSSPRSTIRSGSLALATTVCRNG